MRLSIVGALLGLGPYHYWSFLPQPLLPTVVAHEFDHFIFWDLVDRKTLQAFVTQLQERYGETWLSSRELLESRAVQEGFCDYLASIIYEDPDLLPGLPQRNVAHESFLVHRLALLPHLRGWSQFLWQVRQRWPQKLQADRIVFESLCYWNQAAGLQGGVEALLEAAKEHIRRHQLQAYRTLIAEIIQSTQLLEPPLLAEFDWQIDGSSLKVHESGEFFLMSRIGGLVLHGESLGNFCTQVPGNDPLLVYSAFPDELYLGMLKDGQLLRSPPRTWELGKFPVDPKIKVVVEGKTCRKRATFQIRWSSPYELATFFIAKQGGTPAPAEPIPRRSTYTQVPRPRASASASRCCR